MDGTRERKKADKRRRIVAAATRLFISRGYEGTTTRAIADDTDMSAAVKSFDARPYSRLLNAAELMPGNASRVYLEMERE